MRKLLTVMLLALAMVGGLALADWGKRDKTPGKVDVVAAFYPLQFLAQRIGGRHVAVTDLVKPGAEPHDLELSPKQVAAISDADLVLYLRSLQPSVDAAVAMEAAHHSLDASSVSPLVPVAAGSGQPDALDPHIWLDPVRFQAIAKAVQARLTAVDPVHAGEYAANEAALNADLVGIDQAYASGLAHCQRHEIVTSHAAFGYLADRYHLQQIPITGLAPDAEPRPKTLADVARLARANGATTIFFETLVSPKLADTLARAVGAKAEVLDPIEGIEPGANQTYLTIMRSNLAALQRALGCS